MRLDEIRENYNAENDTLEELKKRLRSKLREIQPDNNNGDYDKDYFNKVNDDLEFIEKQISIENEKKEIKLSSNDLLEFIHEINQVDIYNKNNTKNELQKRFDDSIQEQLVKFNSRFKFKRCSLTGVTALITFLWMLPDKILEHPILKHFFVGNKYFVFMYSISIIWIVCLLCTFLYWIFTLKIERVEKDILEKVKIESVQNELFMDFVKYHAKDKESFSKKDLMNHLLWEVTYEIKNNKLRKIIHDSISREVLQNIADIILERAKEQKIVQKVENHSLIEQFELTKE